MRLRRRRSQIRARGTNSPTKLRTTSGRPAELKDGTRPASSAAHLQTEKIGRCVCSFEIALTNEADGTATNSRLLCASENNNNTNCNSPLSSRPRVQRYESRGGDSGETLCGEPGGDMIDVEHKRPALDRRAPHLENRSELLASAGASAAQTRPALKFLLFSSLSLAIVVCWRTKTTLSCPATAANLVCCPLPVNYFYSTLALVICLATHTHKLNGARHSCPSHGGRRKLAEEANAQACRLSCDFLTPFARQPAARVEAFRASPMIGPQHRRQCYRASSLAGRSSDKCKQSRNGHQSKYTIRFCPRTPLANLKFI